MNRAIWLAIIVAVASMAHAGTFPEGTTFRSGTTFTTGGAFSDMAFEYVLGEIDPATEGGAPASGGNYELGVKLTFGVDGYVHGVKYHLPASGSGTHVANLWRVSDTALLRTKAFAYTGSGAADEDGWQTQLFDTPYPVTAGTLYIVGYTMDVSNTFRTTTTLAPLTIDMVSAAGNVTWHRFGFLASPGNSVFGTRGIFPTTSSGGQIYFIEAMFSRNP